jgi:hypothetical protein
MGPIVNHPLPAGIVNINEARKVLSVRGFQARAVREDADGPPVTQILHLCQGTRLISAQFDPLERDNTALEEVANGISSRRVFRTKQLGGDLAWFDTNCH